MLRHDTFRFLKRLEKNNSTQWANDNRKDLNDAKSDVIEFAATVIEEISAFDPSIAKRPPKPEKCVTRLNRDMRFGRGKGPYKTDFYIVVGLQGIQGVAASYAVHVEPGNCFAGGGAPNPTGADLLNYRRKISDNFTDFSNIVLDASFIEIFPNGIQSQSGNTLKGMPRHFQKHDPAARFLKKDGFITREFLANDRLVSPDGLPEIVRLLEGSKSLVNFLNKK